VRWSARALSRGFAVCWASVMGLVLYSPKV
jgi:hypothetical protein